ncbi:hypothetical protein RHMOL_Rhmol06G0259300 [Rhododendron molle]|uniref:Uncharacterized protein n=1 Tax=Rhododendron molle TaxID=49168 RepID=A0ACC0NH17_RHOML|nr:hypothetical protein RHMOL_Rhmol06G0259300 [Rhododendron molle]
MLKSCRKYSDAISAFVNKRYRPCHGTPLTPADWKICLKFMKFLKVFYVATVACSGVCYPTFCIVFSPHIIMEPKRMFMDPITMCGGEGV